MAPRLILPLLLLFAGCAAVSSPASCESCFTSLPDGSVYRGEQRNGLLHGKGTLTFSDGSTYEGEFQEGRMHGQGTYTDADGDVLKGEFADGEPAGRGVIEYAHGDVYEGEWLNWLANGEGTWTTEAGHVYSGRFEDDVLSGDAQITLADGGHYQGEVQWWRFHGQGTLTTADGDVYTGTFEHGSYDGHGTLETAGGRTYTGGFRAGRYHGEGELTWTDEAGAAHTLEGPWSNGYYVGVDRARHVAHGLALPNAEDVLFGQHALLERAAGNLAPETPGRTDLYVMTFAGHGRQDVFRKEALFAASALERRYGTTGRSLNLINNPRTLDTAPLATGTNLKFALRAVADTMDTEEDILLLFLTSHGSRDHELSVNLPGAPLNDLGADELRRQLDDAGIRWRVIVISACYSGGFIPTLRDEHTMVITSARSDRTSFGCSDDAELTYFGRAFFEQALPTAASLEDAFFTAREAIRERELENGYEPSEPQFHTTRHIDRKLDEVRPTDLAGN